MRSMDWWVDDGEKPLLSLVLTCGRIRAVLGSHACVALLHEMVEQGVEHGDVGSEFPMMADRYEFEPGDAHRMLFELDALRSRLSYLGIAGAAVLGPRGEPIEFIPGCGKPWLFYNEARTVRVGLDMNGLITLDERKGEPGRESRGREIARGQLPFDVWTKGPWGPDICLFGGVPGFPAGNGSLEPCTIKHGVMSASVVLGGMLDLISIVARESQRTGERVEKEV